MRHCTEIGLRGGHSVVPTSTSSPGNAYTYESDHSAVLYRISAVSLLNLVLNLLRPYQNPDDLFSDVFAKRLVRALWDCAMAGIALQGTKGNQPPATFIILAKMLLLTGLVDVLFWSPLYAFSASFESSDCVTWSFPNCSPLRLFVSVQCFAVGMFCIIHSVAVDGVWKQMRDEAKEARVARARRRE